MDGQIKVIVRGNHLSMDSNRGGVQGEANVTNLRIHFDKSWDGFTKTVNFFNAFGENPVRLVLTADRLEDMAKDTRVYLCPIPGEALTEAGWFSFIIEGAVGNKKQRCVSAQLHAEAAESTDGAAAPNDPTPTQVEQLQAQIENLLGDMQELAVTAQEVKESIDQSVASTNDDRSRAEAAAREAEDSKTAAASSAASANKAATMAAESSDAAIEGGNKADSCAARAEKAATYAGDSAEVAGTAADAAGASESMAKTYAITASLYAQTAGNAADEAEAAIENIDALLASYITVSKTDITPGVTVLPNGRLYAYYTE